MKNILFINGSPRKNGNTETLLEKMIEGAKDKKANIKSYNLVDLNYKGCQSCFYCKSNDGCGLKDDMQELYKEIKKADVMVIGTPIYMWQMTSLTKAFLERFYALWVRNPQAPVIQGKSCVLAFTYGAQEGTFDNYINSINDLFNFGGMMKVIETIKVGGLNDHISQSKPEALAKAYALGQTLV